MQLRDEMMALTSHVLAVWGGKGQSELYRFLLETIRSPTLEIVVIRSDGYVIKVINF
jgi:hypothetical protein